MPNPWDIFPILQKGDDNENNLFLSVGQALTAWEQLEFGLFLIYQMLAHSPHFASEAAYGSIVSFEARTGMILAAAKRILPSPDSSPVTKKLIKLLNDAGKLAGRRNEIAHGQVQHVGDTGCYLTHSFTNSRKMKPTPKNVQKDKVGVLGSHGYSYAYTSLQVRTYAESFSQMRREFDILHLEIENELRRSKSKPL